LRGVVACAVGLASALLVAAMLPPSAAASTGAVSEYIVTAVGVPTASLVATVDSTGASVLEDLGVADSVLADLNSSQVSALSLIEGISVIPDVSVSLQEDPSGSRSAQPSAVFPQQTGATQLWGVGDTGAGVNVAVLDTGIDALPDFAGRLVGGVDLTGDGEPFEDDYGHGTFDAGLIAGDGASSDGAYMGEAPGAGLVSIKVAGPTGVTDLATVIEGVSWAISNKAAMNIDVLNMSLGFEPLTSTVVDPLDIAVQAAWESGIVVVVSAGNAGPFNGTILSPGDDPMVITVGALDDLGQTDPADDTMTDFSSVGPTDPDGWFKPDLVASGRSVVSLAAPGSTIYDDYPSALIGSANFVGSGTSFSTAITSGAVALILAADPGISPNEVKARLLASTLPGPVGNPFVDGHGDLNVYGAVTDGQPGSIDLEQAPPTESTALGTSLSLSSPWTDSSWNPDNWSSSAWTNPV